MRTLAAGLLAAAAFVLNPAGCTGPTYEYSAKDIMKAVAGTWTMTRGEKTVSFRLEPVSAERHSARESLVPAAHACGNRSLIAEAGACVDTSTMVFDVVVADAKDAQGTAKVLVPGTKFVVGQLHVHLFGGSDDSFDVSFRPDGEVEKPFDEKVIVTHAR